MIMPCHVIINKNHKRLEVEIYSGIQAKFVAEKPFADVT